MTEKSVPEAREAPRHKHGLGSRPPVAGSDGHHCKALLRVRCRVRGNGWAARLSINLDRMGKIAKKLDERG